MRLLVSWLRQIYLTLAIFNNSVGTTTVKVANNDPAYTNHRPFERVKDTSTQSWYHNRFWLYVDPVISNKRMLWIYAQIEFVICINLQLCKNC